MNSATKRLINFPVVFFLRPPAEGESESSRVSSSGPHGRRLESLHERVKAFLLFVMEWEEREPREAAAVATLVHDVFYARDSALGNDEL